MADDLERIRRSCIFPFETPRGMNGPARVAEDEAELGQNFIFTHDSQTAPEFPGAASASRIERILIYPDGKMRFQQLHRMVMRFSICDGDKSALPVVRMRGTPTANVWLNQYKRLLGLRMYSANISNTEAGIATRT